MRSLSSIKTMICFLCALWASGCSLNPNAAVTLKIQIENQSTQNTRQLKSDAHQSNAAPVGISNFDCLAINIMGSGVSSADETQNPDGFLDGLLNKNSRCSYPGVTSASFSPSQASFETELTVPSGPNRIIQVFGVEDLQHTVCNQSGPIKKFQNTGANFYEIGRQTINLFTNTVISINNDYDKLSASLKDQQKMNCNESSSTGGSTGGGSTGDGSTGGGGGGSSPITASSFSYSLASFTSVVSSVNCNAGQIAVFGGVDCGTTKISGSYSSSTADASSGNVGAYWVGSCTSGGTNYVYGVCSSDTTSFSNANFVSESADCGSGKSAIFASLKCQYEGRTSCPSTTSGSASACSTTDVAQYWKANCTMVANPNATPGAVCVSNNAPSGTIQKSHFRYVFGSFTTGSIVASCNATEKAIGGVVTCTNDYMVASCPSSNGICTTTLAAWDKDWYFKCTTSPPAGTTYYYMVICVQK